MTQIPLSNYVKRRLRLCNILGDGIAIIPNYSKGTITTPDYYFSSEENFYYLTGSTEADAVLVLDVLAKKSIIFCQEKNPIKELWNGVIVGLEANSEKFDEAFCIDQFPKYLEQIINDDLTGKIYYEQGVSKYDSILMAIITKLRNKKYGTYLSVNDINIYVSQMRLIKEAEEISLIKKAVSISSEAHIECMRHVSGMLYEHEVEAKFRSVCHAYGYRQLAYNPICASGANACTLHYNDNNAMIAPNGLLLLDAGVQVEGYASDITRTYPSKSNFTIEQEKIYEIVLAANLAAINAVKLGVHYGQHGDVALKVIVEGLIDIGLLKGSVKDNIENNRYKDFYMHSIGHWMGLLVHDVGYYEEKPGTPKQFAAGMVFTVEPGIYIRPSSDIPENYWNIGVRIEDDLLITDDKVEVLSSGVPKHKDDIMAIMKDINK